MFTAKVRVNRPFETDVGAVHTVDDGPGLISKDLGHGLSSDHFSKYTLRRAVFDETIQMLP